MSQSENQEIKRLKALVCSQEEEILGLRAAQETQVARQGKVAIELFDELKKLQAKIAKLDQVIPCDFCMLAIADSAKHCGPNLVSVLKDQVPKGNYCRTREEHQRFVEEAVAERLNIPEVIDFIEAIKIEAAHQQEKWKKTDPEKTDADWFWLIGWLGGKAVMDPHEPADDRMPIERKLHRIITVAAAAYNWHSWAKRQG